MSQSPDNYKKILVVSGLYYKSDVCKPCVNLVLKLCCQHVFVLLRTRWLWVNRTTRRWSSSVRNLTRLWERAGLPKSTGWPTMWLRTIAPRAAEPPHSLSGVVGSVSAREDKGVPWRWADGRPPLKKGMTSRYSPVSPPRNVGPLKLTVFDISTETRRGKLLHVLHRHISWGQVERPLCPH